MKKILECMDTIPQGVFIVGTKQRDRFNFMTAAFVTQVSFNPPSLALSVANNHYTAELIREQKAFSLSVLANGQEDAAKACGFQSGRRVDKSSRVKYHLLESGLPAVDGAAASMACQVKQVVEYEDHTVFFAEIQTGELTDAESMIYHSEEFFPAK